MPADLTDETYVDGTIEQQIRYWKQKRVSIGGVRSVSTRDKTVEYDGDAIDKIIADLIKELFISRRTTTTVYSKHCRST